MGTASRGSASAAVSQPQAIGTGSGPPALPDRQDHLICVVTRFRLRSPLWLLPTYLDYRRIAREAKHAEGLIREAFLVQNPVTCYALSIWTGAAAIDRFGTDAHAHLDAARRMNRRARAAGAGRREIWSTRWRLEAASHNLNWPGIDFAKLVASEIPSALGHGSEA